MENQEINNTAVQETEQKPVETIEIKFSRKLARPFTSSGGKDMVAIKIPNADPEDKRAWEEFVLPVKMVHSDHYGSKTLWAKIRTSLSLQARSIPRVILSGQSLLLQATALTTAKSESMK